MRNEETADERRARRAAPSVVVFSSHEEMAEHDLEIYRRMTGEERLRVLTALVNPNYESSRERAFP